MTRTRATSLALLTVGSVAVIVGMYLWFGLGAMIVAAGILLILADLVVPDR